MELRNSPTILPLMNGYSYSLHCTPSPEISLREQGTSLDIDYIKWASLSWGRFEETQAYRSIIYTVVRNKNWACCLQGIGLHPSREVTSSWVNVPDKNGSYWNRLPVQPNHDLMMSKARNVNWCGENNSLLSLSEPKPASPRPALCSSKGHACARRIKH